MTQEEELKEIEKNIKRKEKLLKRMRRSVRGKRLGVNNKKKADIITALGAISSSLKCLCDQIKEKID